MDCRLTCIKRGRSRNGSCLFLCPLMNKSTLEQANQAVATINLKGRKQKDSRHPSKALQGF